MVSETLGKELEIVHFREDFCRRKLVGRIRPAKRDK